MPRSSGIPHWTGDLGESLKQPGLEAVILATPTQMHADQAVQCLKAGKHVQVEIPMADSLADSERILKAQKETGLIAMAGHTRRFNPSHQWIHKRVKSGEFKVQQMNVQTYFFRRTNMNAAGKPRSWTDHLLWHHACHTVDLFAYQTGENISECYALEGPHHPELKIAMDMSIGLKVPSGAICTLSLSFNNKGPQGTFFRYIGDTGTYVAYYDDLVDGEQKQDRSQQGGCFHERHRAAGSRIFRRHPRKARTECQRSANHFRDANVGQAGADARVESRDHGLSTGSLTVAALLSLREHYDRTLPYGRGSEYCPF